MWKRYSCEITHRWDLSAFDTDEEHPRPEYFARLAHIKKKKINLVTGQYEPAPPFWKMRVPGAIMSLSSVLFLVLMALAAVMGVILYRMSVMAALSIQHSREENIITAYPNIFITGTSAFINLICIFFFNMVNK